MLGHTFNSGSVVYLDKNFLPLIAKFISQTFGHATKERPSLSTLLYTPSHENTVTPGNLPVIIQSTRDHKYAPTSHPEVSVRVQIILLEIG